MALSYDVAGSGTHVVLLHSTACDRRMWDPQWAALTERHRVLRPDFRGYGQTPRGTGPYTDAEDVLALMDSLAIDSAALVGASFGGRIAQVLAADHPERVSRLALLCAGTPGGQPGPDMDDYLQAEARLTAAEDVPGIAELFARTWLGPAADDSAREAVRAMRLNSARMATEPGTWGTSALVDLREITAPTLVVSGRHDLPTYQRIAREVADRVPGARLLELDWAGHLPSLERPAETTALLLEFLAVP
ncbi:alpha/beta hydrolase [Kutzneria viridogrisea]|uniref:Pimeloyl-ACP methyl ester carboxylesterase n=1 Tax=Kutzneria viridogrisea TaxID=47990 RepID=A0ABR6BWA3_9PSEU|nr:pimeloyl-ACP methyl ester carboxylesterase [Kutzneria viridogrisea]